MVMVDTGDVRLHVQRMTPKGGRPVTATAVLVHGLLTDSLASYYFTLAPVFAVSGIDVIMYDLRGHGRSERPESGYRLDDHLDDLAALLDRLEVTGPVQRTGTPEPRPPRAVGRARDRRTPRPPGVPARSVPPPRPPSG